MDATSEDALLAAGIMNARGLVTAVNSDANNVFITLTAKGLRPDIFVMARSSEEKNEAKLIKAGATRVVSPYLIGAAEWLTCSSDRRWWTSWTLLPWATSSD